MELNRARNKVKKTVAAAAKVINCSPGKINHMESGRNQQQPSEVTALMRSYGADQADIDRLASLAANAGEQTWWAPWTDVVPDWLKTFVGLEGLARRALTYSCLVIPALWQVDGYSLAATEENIRVRRDHSERLVALRMERQSRLFSKENPLRLSSFIEEAVLDRPIGGPEVMKAQYEHLLRMIEGEPDLPDGSPEAPLREIRVVKTSVGPHDALVGPFTVLEFAQAQPIAYIEIVNGAIYVQDQDQVDGYTRSITQLRKKALSREESFAEIKMRLDAVA
ncbi:helix-turn-helix domain-containing protein [Lentzea terrae]|uniref:helix-turn-helix domain-containing protein n=1 Tax=Lentzea terrae TaxID=2200761 RepID=UPI001E37A5F3|nr:helix-turn-helix transcriptional regulator [Lentzea terrae]